MKRRGLEFVVLIVFSLLAISCDLDVNLAEDGKTYEGSATWMSRLGEGETLAEITIPGTHDTCALYDFMGLSGTAAAQDLTLREQLDAGVRGIDIRIHKSGSSYQIHHGPAYQRMSLSDVLGICYDFLDTNPGETIIFLARAENGSTGADIVPGIEAEIAAAPERWISNDADFRTLTVGEARGKVVLLKRNFTDIISVNGTSYGLDLSTDSTAVDSGYRESGVYFKTEDPEENWLLASQRIDEAASATAIETLTTIWTSCYYSGQFGIPNIRLASSVINPLLLAKMQSLHAEGRTHLGIIMVDHVTRTLSNAIYSCNSFSVTQ